MTPVIEFMKLHKAPRLTLEKCGVTIQPTGDEIVEVFNPLNSYDYTIFTIYGEEGLEVTALIDIESDSPLYEIFELMFNDTDFYGPHPISVDFFSFSKPV